MLTAKKVPVLPDGTYCDASGLYLRVQGNSRHWVLRIQVAGRRREAGLGSYPDVSLASARERAAALRTRIRSGEDVFAKKKETRLFKDVLEEAFAVRTKAMSLRPSTVSGREMRSRLYVLPVLGGIPVDKVDKPDILTVLLPLVERSVTLADKVRWQIEYVLDYAAASGLRSSPNPATKSALRSVFPSRMEAQHHFESPEFGALQDALPKLVGRIGPSTAGLAAAFISLTALRVGETLSAKWSDISDDGLTLTIPWQTAKTGRFSRKDFRVPLSDQARAILEKTRGKSEYLFPGRDGQMTCKSVTTAIKDATGAKEMTIHGVRSTFRDWCARSGVDYTVAEMCLSHAIGSHVVRAYFRDDLLDQRRVIMQRWADAVMPSQTEPRHSEPPAPAGGEGTL